MGEGRCVKKRKVTSVFRCLRNSRFSRDLSWAGIRVCWAVAIGRTPLGWEDVAASLHGLASHIYPDGCGSSVSRQVIQSTGDGVLIPAFTGTAVGARE